MEDFTQFATENGLLIEAAIGDDRIHRCPTVEKPKRLNGAYRYDGSRGWVQNWSRGPAISFRDRLIGR